MVAKSQSNKLVSLIVVVVLIFISALIWKKTNPSNEEKITVKDYTNVVKEASNSKPKKYDFKDIDSQSNNDSIDDVEEEVAKKEKRMKWTYTYTSPELIVNGIRKYRKEGDHDSANELIGWLDSFPDFDIPDDI